MKIIVTLVKAKDLKSGDLFTTASQPYWDNFASHHSIGEKVYIRTDEPTPPDQAEDEIYKIVNIQIP